MTNLLRANFFRMRRDHMFWTCFGTVLACSAGFVILWCWEDIQRGFQVKLEQHYFNMAMSLGFFIAMFAAMFLNAEYSDGTIRNKLTVGCTRREVYLANFLTVLTASLFFTAAWLIGGCAGIPMIGPWGFGLGGLAFHVLIVVGSTVAFAAIFTFLGMLLSRRTATVTVVLSWFALLLAASTVENTLSEPEPPHDRGRDADDDPGAQSPLRLRGASDVLRGRPGHHPRRAGDSGAEPGGTQPPAGAAVRSGRDGGLHPGRAGAL